MNAILLAAGLGTRLRPYTNETPKCLMKIKGRCLLEIWLEALSNAGICKFLINTHYLKDKVIDFIESSEYRDRITVTYEKELLGTAGTFSENLEFYGDGDGMLIHADNYCLANMSEFIKAHLNRPAVALGTMMTFRSNDPSACGIVELDNYNIVTRFHEKVKNPPGNLANGAIYIFSKEFISNFNDNYPFAKEITLDVIPNLIGKLYSHETNAIFIDIGTPQSYLKANI
jgi:mannose-1-phosphate guanylyltransferase